MFDKIRLPGYQNNWERKHLFDFDRGQRFFMYLLQL